MFSDRTYVVTGASSGIGASLCGQLLAGNARVIAVSRREVIDNRASLQWLECDLSDPKQVTRLSARLSSYKQPLSGVILCHGFGDFGSLEEFSESRVRALIDTNLTSTILIARACLPGMKIKKSGNLVFLGSEAGLKGGKKGAVYCATKFGLRGLAQSLRQECAAGGVKVTIVNPGMVDTPFFDPLDFKPGEAQDNALSPSEVAQAILSILSMRPGAVVDELNLSPLKTVIRNK